MSDNINYKITDQTKQDILRLLRTQSEITLEYYSNIIFPQFKIKSAPELNNNQSLRLPVNMLAFIYQSKYTEDENIRRIRNAVLWYLQRNNLVRRNPPRFIVAESILKLTNERNMYDKNLYDKLNI